MAAQEMQGAGAYTNGAPTRSREGPPTQTLRARRRTSPASKTSRPKTRSTPASLLSVDTSARVPAMPARSPNLLARPPAASPELISSLIDQLSAISGPTARHGLPSAVAPASRTSLGGHGDDDDRDLDAPQSRSPYYSAVRAHNDLFPDDACEPPVVRTSKPPSGLSPMTAPPKARSSRDKAPASLASYVSRSPSSTPSLHSCHSHRSSHSFGAISIEAGPKPVTSSSARSSLDSKRSVKRPRSLMYMGSRERLRLKDQPLEEGRRGAAPLFSQRDTIKEEPAYTVAEAAYTVAEPSYVAAEPSYVAAEPSYAIADPSYTIAEPPSHATTATPRHPSPARRIRLNLVDGPSSESPMDPHVIPDRGSSLRHSSPKKGKRSSSSSASKSRAKGKEPVRASHEPVVTLPEEPPVDPEEERKQRLLLELEQEENETAQRIKQLREQKLLRERSAGTRVAQNFAHPAHPAHTAPGVSDLPSPDDSPASPASTTSPTSPTSHTSDERTQDLVKAHRLLGISTVPPRSTMGDTNKPLPSIEPREPTRPPPLPPHMRHSRHRSLTLNDGDDLPLPINYALALKTLDTSAPNSPRTPRVDSTQLTLPPMTSASPKSTRDGLKRSSSLSVGGRSALGRKANSMVMGGPKHHRHSSSLTEERPTTHRSASEEVAAGRHSSLSMASAANSFSLQQKKTLKKKRWSHPDLPAKAEKAHNAKVDAAEAAEAKAADRASHYPMNPWSPVIEERPTSLDSVDMDVNAYLHAPRLSQKLRHPQTGRVISFSEVGDPNGYAVFVCVGMGLTRFVMAFYDQLAATLKLRLITPERPGVAGSQVDPNGTPLTWPDDVLIICQALKITKFSLLAHSAGAIYALATALRMPQHIRGRVHLLAPWIPPSQMAPIGIGRDSPPTQQLPRSQRFLRALPPSLLRVANSTFLSNQSASLHGPAKPKRKPPTATAPQPSSRTTSPAPRPLLKENRRESMLLMDQILPGASTLTLTSTNPHDPAAERARLEALSLAERARATAFDERLTFAIWDRATAGANPATDLMVCLETKQPIGFRYEDINRPVVMHHGSKDSRVPVDNVRWLGKLMRKCEVRVLEGEQHGLMASAKVMGGVLSEIAGEWEDWTSVVRQASVGDLRGLARRAG